MSPQRPARKEKAGARGTPGATRPAGSRAGAARSRKATRAAKKSAPSAAEVVKAAGAADLARMEALHARGADWNASWRNYRPLHALLQEDPHGAHAAGKAEAQRLRGLDWLLEHAADPEGLGAWPSARAIVVAAFVGVPEYVERLRRAGARVDLHVEAALGELAAARRRLAREAGGTDARDEGGLTPLACCAGSRLFRDDARGRERLRGIAALLLDAGAAPNARVRSWGHDVDVAYFAIGAGHLELLELLLARGADPDSALVSAAWQRTAASPRRRSGPARCRTARARAIGRS